MALTNEMIIQDHAQQLAKEGKIAYTGKTVTMDTGDGVGIVFKETEQIHTYARWKAMGYQVRRGEKAVAKFRVWKYASAKKKIEDDGEDAARADRGKMFMKQAAFFSASQVDPV